MSLRSPWNTPGLEPLAGVAAEGKSVTLPSEYTTHYSNVHAGPS